MQLAHVLNLDIFPLLCSVFQLYCSNRAWAGLSHAAVIQSVCHERLQLVFPDGAMDAYVELARACMAYDPEQRPTCDDILEVLTPFAQAIHGSA